MINQLITNFVLNILIIASLVIGIKFSSIHDAEINRLLKQLNKPTLKSIQSPDGDIIDCVHIENHPIYDHPLFKNHTIQMRPSPHSEGWRDEPSYEEKKSLVTQLWTINGKCPKNSIPIRRTKREDILRVKSIERYGKKNPNNICPLNQTNSTNSDIREYALMKVEGMYDGAEGIINVWRPYIQIPQEFSLAKISLAAGFGGELNSIEFGWQVYPSKYRDNNTRFFTYWSSDNGYRTGCYNLDCPGFVLVNREFALGAVVHNVSIANGPQYQIPTTIWKDSRTGHWWLKLNYHTFVGYWPSTLFNHLRNGATFIAFGGEISNDEIGGQHTTTKMGSGQFAGQGYQKAAYFRNLRIFDQHSFWKPIQEISPKASKPFCYNVIYRSNSTWGKHFYYGGPGKNIHCL